jgi:hypothetical protein
MGISDAISLLAGGDVSMKIAILTLDCRVNPTKQQARIDYSGGSFSCRTTCIGKNK